MKNKKYELTDEITIICGTTLHRIRALKDFGNVIKGDLGGFIEGEKTYLIAAHVGFMTMQWSIAMLV